MPNKKTTTKSKKKRSALREALDDVKVKKRDALRALRAVASGRRGSSIREAVEEFTGAKSKMKATGEYRRSRYGLADAARTAPKHVKRAQKAKRAKKKRKP